MPEGFDSGTRSRGELSVPLAALASAEDHDDATYILSEHLPRQVARAYCGACKTEWPCDEVRYAWAISGAAAETVS